MTTHSSSAALVEIADAAPWVSKSSSSWVRGPVWDGFWALSATESLARLRRSVYRMSDLRVPWQHVDSSATPARLRQGKWYEISLSFLLSRSSLFLRCTLRLGVRWRHNSLHSRPSTLPSLYIARNGRNRGSRGKELSWSQPIKRLAELLERECSRAPGTSYLMALPSKHIRSGVSSRARCRNLGGLFRGRGSFPRHNGLSRWPGWYAEITRNPCGRLHIFCGHRADCGSRPTSRRSSQIVSQNALLDVQWSMNAPGP